MRRIRCAVLAALTILPVAALSADHVSAAPSRVLYGEYQKVANVTPPTRLDIAMAPRSWAVNAQRCADMGGDLGKERFRGRVVHVCHGVDY